MAKPATLQSIAALPVADSHIAQGCRAQWLQHLPRGSAVSLLSTPGIPAHAVDGSSASCNLNTAELSRPSKMLCGEGGDGAGGAGEAPEPIPGVHVPGELPRWISERIRTVRDSAGSSAGVHAASNSRRASGGRELHCVLYWMSTAIRGHENPALDVAKAEARRAGDCVQGRSLSSVKALDIWHYDHSAHSWTRRELLQADVPGEQCCFLLIKPSGAVLARAGHELRLGRPFGSSRPPTEPLQGSPCLAGNCILPNVLMPAAAGGRLVVKPNLCRTLALSLNMVC